MTRSFPTRRSCDLVETVLLARNNKVLGRAVTDADGRADFAAGLLRGRGGNEATALLAYGPNHDFTILRLSGPAFRSEEHTSELQSLMRISYAVFCLHKNIYACPNSHGKHIT